MGKLINEFKYHLGKCHEVGGSITIPHYRRTVEYWNELSASNKMIL